MLHPDIAMMNGRERVRELLAEAERRRLAREAREAAWAARPRRRLAAGLSRALLKGARG